MPGGEAEKPKRPNTQLPVPGLPPGCTPWCRDLDALGAGVHGGGGGGVPTPLPFHRASACISHSAPSGLPSSASNCGFCQPRDEELGGGREATELGRRS